MSPMSYRSSPSPTAGRFPPSLPRQGEGIGRIVCRSLTPRSAPAALHDDLASAMFDQLEAWAGALKPLRAGGE
jgi:hypothetical protein